MCIGGQGRELCGVAVGPDEGSAGGTDFMLFAMEVGVDGSRVGSGYKDRALGESVLAPLVTDGWRVEEVAADFSVRCIVSVAWLRDAGWR